MYILSTVSAMKNMTLNELKDFTFEKYYRQIGFPKENSYCSMKL